MFNLVFYIHQVENNIQPRPPFRVPQLMWSYYFFVTLPHIMLIFQITSPAWNVLYYTPTLQQYCWWGTSPLQLSLEMEQLSFHFAPHIAEWCRQVVLFPFYALLPQMVRCNCLRIWSILVGLLGLGHAKLHARLVIPDWQESFSRAQKQKKTGFLRISFFGKIGNMPHPGHVEIFVSHRKFVKFFYHTECRTCPNITLCNRLLKYHIFVEVLVKYTYFVFKTVIITHLVFFTIYFITLMHPW